MKKLVLVVCLTALAGCSAEGERLGPPPSDLAWFFGNGSGGGSTTVPAPAQPAQPAGGDPVVTGLAKSQASPEPSPTPSATESPLAEPSAVPQAVPDQSLATIPGYQEVHNVSSRLTCQQMQQKFREQGLRLTLFDVFELNQPGRLNAPRRRSRRNSSNYGRMFVCIFRGLDAVENRYGLNDDYERAGVPYPQQYPNDYRPPQQPFDDYNYSQDPHMGNQPTPPADAEPPF